MKRALILVGSPRGKKSTSMSISSHLAGLLAKQGMETEIVLLVKHVDREEPLTRVLDAVEKADIVFIAAPLYDDCQPYIVIKTMEAIAARSPQFEKKWFFPIINCGFPEPEHITAAAIPIYHRFATSCGFIWGGSLAVGGGEMLLGSQGKTLEEVGPMAKRVKHMLGRIVETVMTNAPFPDVSVLAYPGLFNTRLLSGTFLKLSNAMWKKRAKANNSSIDDRPYE